MEKKSSLSYLIKLDNEIKSIVNLNLGLSVSYINYYRFNNFLCEFFSFDFISDNAMIIKFSDRFYLCINIEGEIKDSVNKKLINFFSKKDLTTKFNKLIVAVYSEFCDDYIQFFKQNFRNDFWDKYSSDIENDGDFILDYKPKFLIRKKVNRRDVTKRYKRGEGRSYIHYFTFEFTFDILDNSILDDVKFKKCQELLLNNTLEVVDDSDDDHESFSTIYDNVKIFSGQIDYNLTNQVDRYIRNGNPILNPNLFFSNIKFDESNSILQEEQEKALFFLLTRDIDEIIRKKDNNVIFKMEFVEYLFYCYNFYIENKKEVRYSYFGQSFFYDFSRFKSFDNFNSVISRFMMDNLSPNILSSFENLFLYKKIECDQKLNSKLDLHFLNFLRYNFHSKL